MMSMHWGVANADTNQGREVVREYRSFLKFPTHLFTECQAANAVENNMNAAVNLAATPTGATKAGTTATFTTTAAHLLSGSIQLQLGRWPEAEKDLARAVALDPKNARAWASLAQARIALKDLPGATAAHERAVALAPTDPFVKEVGERLARATPKPADAAAPALQPAAQVAPPAPAPAKK
jgi:tetratricopeptide (TPR) repeat protein